MRFPLVTRRRYDEDMERERSYNSDLFDQLDKALRTVRELRQMDMDTAGRIVQGIGRLNVRAQDSASDYLEVRYTLSWAVLSGLRLVGGIEEIIARGLEVEIHKALIQADGKRKDLGNDKSTGR